MNINTGKSSLIQIKLLKNNNNIVMTIPNVKEDIPIGVVLLAYDYDLDDLNDIVDEEIKQRILYNINIKTKEEAYDYIINSSVQIISDEKQDDYVNELLYKNMFQHITDNNEYKNIEYILYMLSTHIKVIKGDIEVNDRDHISNKRCEVAGILVHDLFRNLWKRNRSKLWNCRFSRYFLSRK